MREKLYSKEWLSKVLSFFLTIIFFCVVGITMNLNSEIVYAANNLWDSERNAYVIKNSQDFHEFLTVQKDHCYKGAVVLLDNDIVIPEETQTKANSILFAGYFNGQGHKIKGIGFTKSNFILSLEEGGVITNVNFENCNLKRPIINFNSGTITNCIFQGKEEKPKFPGIIGTNRGKIENCLFNFDFAGTNRQAVIANNSGGTLRNSIYIGTMQIKNPSTKRDYYLAFSNRGTVDNCYYINTNTYTKGGLGISCSPEEMKNSSTYQGFDFTNIWDIQAGINNGYPFLRNNIAEEFLPPVPEMIVLPLSCQVSLEDVDYNAETGEFTRYFPIKVSELQYTGTDEKIKNTLPQILKDTGIQVNGRTINELHESDRKKITVIPQEGYQITVNEKADSFVKTNLGKATEMGYVPDITISWAENGNTARFTGKVVPTELSLEEKNNIIVQAKETMKQILDMNATKYPSEISGDPWFAFNCARAGYYPEGITEEQLYEGIVNARWQKYVGMSESELQAVEFDMGEVSKDVLAITAMGYDATNVKGLNLIDILGRSKVNGKYFSMQYRLYAMYSGDYGQAYHETAEGMIGSTNFETIENRYDADDMATMQLQPLFLTKNDDKKTARVASIEKWLSQSQTLIGTFPGFNGYANPWTNAQVHILMGTLDIDWLSPKYVKNGKHVLSTLFMSPESTLQYGAERSQCVKAIDALVRSAEGREDLFNCSDVKEARYVNLEVAKLKEIPAENDKEKVYALWDVYSSLSDSKKESVKDAQKLENVVNYFKVEEANKAKAEDYCKRVDTFTVENVTLEDRQTVENLKKELESMDEAVKKYVPEEYNGKLEVLSNRLRVLQDADNVAQKIHNIGEVTLDSEKAILDARNDYEALSEEAKQVLNANGVYKKLQDAEEKLEILQQVNAVMTNIDRLSSGVTLADEEFLITVRDQYNALPESSKEKVTNYYVLEEAEKQMKTLKLEDCMNQIMGLPNMDELVTKDEEGNEIYTISEETVLAAAKAKAAWDDVVRKYPGIEDEVKASAEYAELLNKLMEVSKLAEKYNGYVETYLEPLVAWLMNTTTVDELNLAQTERQVALYEEYMVSYGAYLNSIEGLSERVADLKAQAQSLRDAMNEAKIIQQMIDKLPQGAIISEEMLETAQKALADVDAAAEGLSQQAKDYIDWKLYNTLSTQVELYLEKKEQAEKVSAMIAVTQTLAEEKLTSDETVVALKQAQNAYDKLATDVQTMVVDAELLETLKDQISHEKTKAFKANGILTIKETIPYDVVVKVVTADKNTEKVLAETLKDDKKANLMTAFTLETYMLLADGSTQPWDAYLTAVITADENISDQNVFVIQMTDKYAYIKNIADGSTLTFVMDSAASYAVGLRKADDGDRADKLPGDAVGGGNKPGGSNNANTGNNTSGGNGSVPKTSDVITQEIATGILLTMVAASMLVMLNKKRKMN